MYGSLPQPISRKLGRPQVAPVEMPAGFKPDASPPPQRLPLQDAIPEYHVERGSLCKIDVPSVTVETGHSAVYPLFFKRFSNGEPGMSLVGLAWDVFSPDQQGTFAGDALAWGTTSGLGARVIFAKNHQTFVVQNSPAWLTGRVGVAGVENGINHVTARDAIFFDVALPGGRLTDTTPLLNTGRMNTSWMGLHFRPGDTLFAGLAVRGSVIAAGNTKSLYCNVSAQAILARGSGASYFNQ